MSTAGLEQSGFAMAEQWPLVTNPKDFEIWHDLNVVAEPPIYGRNGDRLPSVALSNARFEWYSLQAELEEASIMHKRMAVTTRVSQITGCWLPTPERYIAKGGYCPTGDKGAGVNQSGSTTRHRANVQRANRSEGKPPITPEDTWEHFCGMTGCSEPKGHGTMMSIEENNERKNEAAGLDDFLEYKKVTWTLRDIGWLESIVSVSGEGLVDAVMAGRHGAYILEVQNGLIISHKLTDPVRESIRPAAPYPHQKEKVEVHPNQLSANAEEMYADLLRRAIARRQNQIETPLLAA